MCPADWATLVGARQAFEECLGLSRRLAAADPTNVNDQARIAASLRKLAGMHATGVRWTDVVAQYELLGRSAPLDPDDRAFLQDARTRAASEAQP